MFSQPPEKEKQSSKLAQKHKSTCKKRKKQKQRNKKKQVTQIKQSLANSMSTWAENFTMAATWQLKHQVAMWKSKATMLQYENQVLRETLQQFYVGHKTIATSSSKTQNSNQYVNNKSSRLMEYEHSYMDCAPSVSATRTDSDVESSEKEESECEFEVSEEFKAYIRKNAEFRKARDERKKIQADEESRKEKAEIDLAPAIDRTEEFKELYGDAWQRVAALDFYLSSDFVLQCDTHVPNFWPNIPLRL